MNEKRTQGKKSFYTALCICLAMVGFACYFAYSQASEKAQDDLQFIEENSITEEITDPYDEVLGLQTSIPKYEDTETDLIIETTETTVTTTEITEEVTETTVQTTKKKKMKNAAYIVPVDGTIIFEFSNGELVKSSTTGAWQTHNGVDISAEGGTQIQSMYSGTVTSVINDALWGVCIEIDHGNGISARYCGLSKDTAVSEGDTVKTGTVIGYAGNTCEIECEAEPHIHFEVIKGGNYVDPIDLIRNS